jgi:hypothetical protein
VGEKGEQDEGEKGNQAAHEASPQDIQVMSAIPGTLS